MIPIGVDAPIFEWPKSNIVILVLATILSFIVFASGNYNLVVSSGIDFQLTTYMFAHADFWHLFGNMYFLWLFGNPISGLIAWWKYLLFFFLAGVFSGIAHHIFENAAIIGASGAINGVVGFFLVLFPNSKINCLFFAFRFAYVFEIRSYLVILFWFVVDFSGTFYSNDSIAYVGHVSGFLFGVIVGCIAAYYNLIYVAGDTLVDKFKKQI